MFVTNLNILNIKKYILLLMQNLKNKIEELFALPFNEKYKVDSIETFKELKNFLNDGSVRSAEKDSTGKWIVNQWVKRGILIGFRYGNNINMSVGELSFFDKDTLPLRKFSLQDGVRIVPGGSSVRDGAYVAQGVICMPPMYINIGSYVDEGTLVDSHALVGTCAQIGKRVHLSAAAQIGGVLEPIGANPVIIEDDVMVGGNCGIYEGTIVRKRAVLASGVVLTGSSKVFDIVNNKVITSIEGSTLEIPEGAVVVNGSRAIKSEFGLDNMLSISTPIIIKYRDDKTDAKTALESALR
jgi:2,3,4,5-tetrahydropyridine-2-carboxylate N-succinyltransferase